MEHRAANGLMGVRRSMAGLLCYLVLGFCGAFGSLDRGFWFGLPCVPVHFVNRQGLNPKRGAESFVCFAIEFHTVAAGC
jgi:hypothetical protein